MILILGATGQVGQELRRSLAPLGRVVALGRAEADLARPGALGDVVRAHRPRAIVNAAAYTAVDKAESEPELALTVNATAPAVLAREAEALGACLIHYSTDYVFDGRKPPTEAYAEDDTTGPLSVYGRTKLEGEHAVRRSARHLILRTSWVVSPHGTNFVRTMLRLAAERSALRVVADQVGAPTSAALIADVTARMLAAMSALPSVTPADDARWGTYHLAASGETSWNGLARRVIAHARALGMPLACRPEDVAPITTAEYPTAAARPLNSRLDTTKLRSAFGVTLPSWQEGVDAVVERLAHATTSATTQ